VSRRPLVALVGLLALLPAGAAAHEERLMVGRVERIEPARRLLVLTDVQSGERRRMAVDSETEVIVCRTETSLAAVRRGGVVRVKYLERAGGEPEAQSILLLGR
jgi:hypothetical protein